MCLLSKILFLKNTDPKNQIVIFILPTDRTYFFKVLPVDQKINLVSRYISKVYLRKAGHTCDHGVIILNRSNNSVFLYLKIY